MSYTKQSNTGKFDRMIDDLERAEDRIARVIATTVQDFFRDSFQKQGWEDRSLNAWEKRSKNAPRNEGRKLLVDSGALKNSIVIRKQNWPDIVVASEGLSYARIHNEGGTIKVYITPQMRRFFWAKFRETGVLAWKYMAITKEDYFEIDIPQRKFMGHSEAMNQEINKEVKHELNRIIKGR